MNNKAFFETFFLFLKEIIPRIIKNKYKKEDWITKK